jgi:S1-C subfamily serine protease
MMIRWLGGVLALAVLSAPIGVAGAGSGLVRSGTAFFITPSGFMLTSAHVVVGCPRVHLWPIEGRERDATVVARDPVHDIALLSTGAAVHAYVAPGLGARAQIGQPLTTVGYGVLEHSPRLPVLSRGPLLGYAATEYDNHMLVIGTELPEGNSGGPVVDGNGALVGMVIGRYRDRPDRGVALPVEELARFAGKQGGVRAWKAAAADPAPDQVAAVTAVLYSVSGLVQCSPGG